ncbi:hypothetical protein [Candidatus Tisiphia endosymbiont of Beris chalybata]|uniref:hypothetical protein n=1 Tax=Candidatus Tisiphia endosymbiont of Beris chalybata TaxID=3066262 RepID=UPI00312C74EE
MIKGKDVPANTANGLYEDFIKMKETALQVPEARAALQLDAISKAMVYNLRLSLLFGKIEAASELMWLYEGNLGIKPNEYNHKLFTAIGSELGDTKYQGSIARKEDSEVGKEAGLWLEIIKKNKQKYPNKDTQISDAMIFEAHTLISAPSKEEVSVAKVKTLLLQKKDKSHKRNRRDSGAFRG